MSLHRQPSPAGGMALHQATPMGPHAQINGVVHNQGPPTRSQILANLNEAVWIQIGELVVGGREQARTDSNPQDH